MKTSYTIIGALICSTAFSQTNTSQVLDNFGNVAAGNLQSEKPYDFQQVASTNYTYVNMRALNEINVPNQADAYPWISPNGLRLYYTSGANSNGLAFTSRSSVGANFAPPTQLALPNFSLGTSYWFSDNELELYACGNSGLYYFQRLSTSSPFSSPVQITSGLNANSFISSASLNAAQTKLYLFEVNNGGSGIANIAECTRTGPTTFSFTQYLPVPVGFTMTPGQLSKDGLRFVFGGTSGNLTTLYQFSRNLLTDPFTLSSLQQLGGLNSNNMQSAQPTVSDSLGWIVFTKAGLPLWTDNELHIANREGVVSSVFDRSVSKRFSATFPNPSTGVFNFHNEGQKQILLQVHALTGELTYQATSAEASVKIDLAGHPKGIYFLRVTQSDKVVGTEKLIVE